MRRWVRKAGARVVPELIKRRVRKRLYGYRPSAVDIGYKLSRDNGNITIYVGDTIKFRITEDDVEDFTYHLADNGASIEEMYGFIKVSEAAETLFDIGAHRGLFSLVFCAGGSSKHSVAYEPSPSLSSSSKKLAAVNHFEQRMHVQDYAVGNLRSRVSASLEPSGFIRFVEDQNFHQKYEIEVTTIDHECSRLGIDPDIVKIDIEGYEYEALLGAPELLKKKPIICLELHLDLLEQRGIKPKVITDYLEQFGYDFFSSLGNRLKPSDVYGSENAVLRFVAK